MIVINCPMKQDFIIETVTKNPAYHYVETKGMSLLFQSDKDEDQSIADIKAAIKATDIGKVIYFTIERR